MPPQLRTIAPTDTPEPGVFEAIYQALDASSRHVVGPAHPRLLVIPIYDDGGAVAGGLWGCSIHQWFQIQLLFVPLALQGRGVGTALMALAEAEAIARDCWGAMVDTFSFQAAPFYRRLGYTIFAELDDFPPGHTRIFLAKRFRPRKIATAA